MDSYEYYQLYHQDREKFLSLIDAEHHEILIAIKKLLENNKFDENDREKLSRDLIHMILNDVNSNYILDEILEKLITGKVIESSRELLLSNDMQVQHLRILKKVVEVNSLFDSSFEDILIEIYTNLIEMMFRELAIHPYIISIVKSIIDKNKQHAIKIMDTIFSKSIERNDRLGLQNVCYFFDQMCKSDIVKSKDINVLIKYFESDLPTARKQGVYLIKIMIENKLLINSSEWKMFTIIMEALEENQSHLILPTLDLLEQIKVSNEFEKFWFILCKSIMTHENTLINQWGINYILNIKDRNFDREQIIVIVNSLNVTSLYDSQDKNFICNLSSFIEKNFHHIFEILVDVNWMPVPFYYILNNIKDQVKRQDYSTKFLNILQNQTDVLPKRITNLTIRADIQKMYSEMLLNILKDVKLQQVLIDIMINIFKIGNNYDCLDVIISKIQRNDYDLIFCDNHPFEFLKYALFKLHFEKDIDEIKHSARKIKRNKRLVMETTCLLNKFAEDGYENFPDALIHETLEDIWTQMTNNQIADLDESIETLEIGLRTLNSEIEAETIHHLIEIWRKFASNQSNNIESQPIYWKLLKIILKYNKTFDMSFVELECYENLPENLKFLQAECQVSLINYKFMNNKTHTMDKLKITIKNLENLLDKISTDQEYLTLYESIENFIQHIPMDLINENDLRESFIYLLKQFIYALNNNQAITVNFWTDFMLMNFKLIENTNNSSEWMRGIREILQSIMNDFKLNDKFQMFFAILQLGKTTLHLKSQNDLALFLRNCLFEKIFEVEVLSKDQQIELELMCKIDKSTNEKLKFRLEAAKYLHENFAEELCNVIGDKIIELSVISKKKPRYFPHSNIHRMKLHYLQTLIFCATIRSDVMDVLLYELLWINNQLNVTYLLEIIISQHYGNILSIFDDASLVSNLKSQALKSIFTIVIIQMKRESNFNDAEKMLHEIFKKVFCFSMGQNFGVRIYSLLAMVISLEHVKSLENFRMTEIVHRANEICEVISESVKQKNCSKYFNALREDFRFTKSFDEIFSIDSFYHQIPLATNLPFEEIIVVNETMKDKYIVADLMKESEQITIYDDLEYHVKTVSNDGILSLQQKYLPFKYQIPGDNLINTLPNIFKFYDDQQLCTKQKSELIVICSLIDKHANLGGLARTCEIFGTSNFVIDSLKATENSEFTSLSKTAEKWIKMTEIKHWQLFDYLLAMKENGYKIVGAEQSGNSVSLTNTNFPKKSVLLLGNEKEGIPANLLALLDLIIEIPQFGVLRSLNVHVTGAILIWEYAKQHLCNSR